MVGWLRVGVLLELQVVIFEDQYTRLVLVAAAVVRRREDCDYVREAVFGAPAMHLEAFLLNLMATEDAEESVLAQELLDWFLTEVV